VNYSQNRSVGQDGVLRGNWQSPQLAEPPYKATGTASFFSGEDSPASNKAGAFLP
jgi:hypothetical protein